MEWRNWDRTDALLCLVSIQRIEPNMRERLGECFLLYFVFVPSRQCRKARHVLNAHAAISAQARVEKEWMFKWER